MPKKTLTEGFERFRKKYYESGEKLMEKLAREGAHPDFFIINCIDPRNGADLVFDAAPGQQFLHPQMAAIIPPYKSGQMAELDASLSYAIDAKKIKHLIIMGHSQCGGCDALLNGTPDPYITAWVTTADTAKKAAIAKTGANDSDALSRETERQAVILSLENVLEYPMVKQAVKEGRLSVSGWFFDMKQGTLHEYDPAAKGFRPLTATAEKAPVKKPHPPKFGT